jgi:DNA-binding transcriptional regulator YdaS (Cro superfamily)
LKHHIDGARKIATERVPWMPTDERELLERAVAQAGGYRALARELGVRHTTVLRWRRVPAEHVVEIEGISGIPRERLRPDLYRGG